MPVKLWVSSRAQRGICCSQNVKLTRYPRRAALTCAQRGDIRRKFERGFRTVLKPRRLLRSRHSASPFGIQPVHAARTCGSRECALLLVLALGSLWLAGCQSYNANLGAPSAQSSAITLLSPSGKVAGTDAFTLQVSGLGFVTGSIVQWNNSNRPTEVVDSTQLKASISAADIASAGVFQVRVLGPGPTDGNNYSNIVTFQVCSGACPQGVAATSKALSALPAGDAYTPAISADGRYVAFAAVAADPSTNAGTGLRKIFLRDTCQGAPSGCEPSTVLVSQAWHGGEPNGESRSPAISADGRYVVFASDASDIIESDTNGVSDVFLRDTCTGTPEGCTAATTRISAAPDGAEANDASDSPTISADGRFIAFDSAARNIVVDGSSAPTGAFMRDTCRGAVTNCTPSTRRLAISPAAAR
jgi:WD40 repeat protein